MVDGLAEDLFALPVGVNVRGVEKVTTRLEAEVDESACFFYLGIAPGLKELTASTKGAGAKAEFGDFQAGAAELTEFHKTS